MNSQTYWSNYFASGCTEPGWAGLAQQAEISEQASNTPHADCPPDIDEAALRRQWRTFWIFTGALAVILLVIGIA